ncbi:MAG: hypothetical protein RLY97_683 [Pseudomonadota bacterium]|jgi:hypothetical protein
MEPAGHISAGNMLASPAVNSGEAVVLRAHLALGNVSIARQQLGIMLGLGVERVICIAQKLDTHIIELQHFAEDAGAKFHVVTGPRGLLGLVTATDELLALADGLLAWPKMAAGLLDRAGVLVQPVEEGLAAGFERMDGQYASAGALRIPGRLVERLAELPSDSDAFSSLQRIALQAGIAQRMIQDNSASNGSWNLVRHDDDAHAAETQWIRLHSDVVGARNCSTNIAQWAVRHVGPALLHAGSGNVIVASSGLLLALLALIMGWFGWVGAGLGFTGIAAILFISAHLLGRVERELQQLPSYYPWRAAICGWLIDGVILVLVVWNGPVNGGQNYLEIVFPPLILLGLSRILPMIGSRNRASSQSEQPNYWRFWVTDRSLVVLVLMVASWAGVLSQAVVALALLYLIMGLLGGDDHGVIPPDQRKLP